jgi:hypothetical protein
MRKMGPFTSGDRVSLKITAAVVFGKIQVSLYVHYSGLREKVELATALLQLFIRLHSLSTLNGCRRDKTNTSVLNYRLAVQS